MKNYLSTLENDLMKLLENLNLSIQGYKIQAIYNGGFGAIKSTKSMPIIEFEMIPKRIETKSLGSEVFYIDIKLNIWIAAKLNTESKQALKEALNIIEKGIKSDEAFLAKFGIPTNMIDVIYEDEPFYALGVVGWGIIISFLGNNAN